MRGSGGRRAEWHDIPEDVRAAIEAGIGSPVVEAHNEAGGFSPGLAARCRLRDGSRMFIKAVSPAQNRHACRIHRREAEVAPKLPRWLPVPRLRHVHDDGTWVALAFDEIDGRQPSEPWTLDELDHVMPTIVDLGRRADPSPVDGLQSVQDRHGAIFSGWRRLASGDGDADALPAWAADRLHRLADIESTWADAAEGAALLHADLRADNILIGADGQVTIVDWPWACTGAGFVDPLLMVPSIGLGGGPSPQTVIDRYRLADGVDPDAFLAVFVALCGFLLRASQDPHPPGIPALPAFQAAQAGVGLGWLRHRLSASG